MKRTLTGTGIGRLALSLRDKLSLLNAAYVKPESVGTLANDHLAGILTSRLCRSGKTFIDVGAHIGSVTAAVLHADPTVRVVAFEAIPEKVAHLRRKFPRVEIHDCAAGETECETSFFVHTKLSGYSSLGRPSSASSDVQEIKVQIRRLDGVLESDAIDMIKIDVEGAELGVLRGGERLIVQNRPTIMFESGPAADDALGYTKEALFRWFVERDYVIVVPNRVAHDDDGLSESGFIESHLYPRRTTNYFAISRARRIEIRDRARDVLDIRV